MKKHYNPIKIEIDYEQKDCLMDSVPDLWIGDEDYAFDDSPF